MGLSDATNISTKGNNINNMNSPRDK